MIKTNFKKKIEMEYKQKLEILECELKKYKTEKYKDERSYEDVSKTSSVYVIKTDNQRFYKVGKTKDIVSKRIKGLQTANANDIQVLLDFKTHNCDLLERCVHYVLKNYRCDSNREFFDCNIEYINLVVTIIGTVLDTLKSSYQTIDKNFLFDKLTEKLGINLNDNLKNIEKELDENNERKESKIIEENQEEINFHKCLQDNLEYKKNAYFQIKDVLKIYTGKDNLHSSITSNYRKQIEEYIKYTYTSKNIRWKYGMVKIGNKCVRGWKDINIIGNR